MPCLLRWVVLVFAWLVVLAVALKESDYTEEHQHTLLDRVISGVQVRPRVWKRLRDPLGSHSDLLVPSFVFIQPS